MNRIQSSAWTILVFSYAVSSGQLLRSQSPSRDLSDAIAVKAIENNVPFVRGELLDILEKKLESETNINNNNMKNNDNQKQEQYDFARTIKLAPHSLPECTSGNEFLDPDGGSWEKHDDIVKDKFLFRDTKSEHIRDECFSDRYNDPFLWAPNCSIPVLQQQQNQHRPKVLLVGDSLTSQINTAIFDLPDQGMDLQLRWTANMMLSSVKFESQVCTQCQSKIEKKLYDLEMNQYTEEEFVQIFSGYDYIFWNEYAHYVGKFMSAKLGSYYDDELGPRTRNTQKHMVMDAISYFRRQMERKAELFRLHLPNTKFYYRTSPPHAYRATPGPVAPRGEVLPKPSRKPSYQECEDKVDVGFGAMCYSVLNDLAREAFLSNGHQILETAPAISQRTDAHECSMTNFRGKDCLHFCMPGPPNVMLAAIVTEVLAREKEKTQ